MYLMSAPATNALSPAPGEHDDVRRVVLGELAQPVAELGQRLDVERVERLLPVDRDDGDRVAAVDEHAQAGTAPRMKSTISVVGAPGPNTPATPSLFSSAASSSGIVPPTTTTTSSRPRSRSKLDDARHESHVRAGEDRDADGVRVLLDRGLDDLLRRLVEAGVDDLHAGVAERAGDDLGTAIVPVQARLRDDDADLPCHGAEPSSKGRVRNLVPDVAPRDVRGPPPPPPHEARREYRRLRR